MGCDPTAWRPSPAEAAQTGVEASWAKNRNMHLSWEAFDAVLRQVGMWRWPAELPAHVLSQHRIHALEQRIQLTDCCALCAEQVAETGGDMQRYRELWRKGEWWWHVGKDNITFGGHHRSKCSE